MSKNNKNHNKNNKRWKIPNGKRQLHVLISEDLYRKLIQYASAQAGSEGRYRGLLSMIVEDALRLYLEPRLKGQVAVNPRFKVRAVYGQVIEALKRILGALPVDGVVHEKILSLAISEVRGTDPRTIDKWINTFIKSGLMKVLGGTPPNRVFELVYTPPA